MANSQVDRTLVIAEPTPVGQGSVRASSRSVTAAGRSDGETSPRTTIPVFGFVVLWAVGIFRRRTAAAT